MHQLVLSHMGFISASFGRWSYNPLHWGALGRIQCHLLGGLEFSFKFWISVSHQVDWGILLGWNYDTMWLLFFFCTWQWCQSLMGVRNILHLNKLFLISVWITDVFFVLRDQILPRMHHSFCKQFAIRLFHPRVSIDGQVLTWFEAAGRWDLTQGHGGPLGTGVSSNVLIWIIPLTFMLTYPSIMTKIIIFRNRDFDWTFFLTWTQHFPSLSPSQLVKNYFTSLATYVQWTWQQNNSCGKWFIFFK